MPLQYGGRKVLVREREEYFRLMNQGLSSAEACKRIGINYRTGKRWRNGRGAYGKGKARPPVLAVVPAEGLSRYLREADRITSPTGCGRRPPAGGQRPSWAASRPPSAGRSAATGTRPTGGTGRTPPRHAQTPAGPGPAGEDRREPRTALLHPAPSGPTVEPRADLSGSADPVSRPAGHARGPRDGLSGPLPPGPRRAAPETRQSPAHRSRPPQVPSAGPAAHTTLRHPDGHDQPGQLGHGRGCGPGGCSVPRWRASWTRASCRRRTRTWWRRAARSWTAYCPTRVPRPGRGRPCCTRRPGRAGTATPATNVHGPGGVLGKPRSTALQSCSHRVGRPAPVRAWCRRRPGPPGPRGGRPGRPGRGQRPVGVCAQAGETACGPDHEGRHVRLLPITTVGAWAAVPRCRCALRSSPWGRVAGRVR